MKAILPALLGVLFIGLKLTGCIDWSWVWVLAPFWLGFGALIVILGLIVLLTAIVEYDK